jgi:hypothetical protein
MCGLGNFHLRFDGRWADVLRLRDLLFSAFATATAPQNAEGDPEALQEQACCEAIRSLNWLTRVLCHSRTLQSRLNPEGIAKASSCCTANFSAQGLSGSA